MLEFNGVAIINKSETGFDIVELNGNYKIGFKSSDNTTISIEATKTDTFNPDSIFETLNNVSKFMESGALGYSPNGDKYEGLLLKTYHWKVEPLDVISVNSSFFENLDNFPKGSIKFDNALLMTGIEHEWNSVENKKQC